MSVLGCFRFQEEEKKATQPEQNSEEEEEEEEEEDPEEGLDEATKQQMKIELAKKSFGDKIARLDLLFKNNVHLIRSEIRRDENPKGCGFVSGPIRDGDCKEEGDYLWAKAVSCYPTAPKNLRGDGDENTKLGDPICDYFGYEVFESKIVVLGLADGCNWGPKPYEAAHIAVDVFHAEVTKRLADITTIRKASKILVKAFMEAHTRILQGPISRGIQDIWEAGTTTLLGGVVLRVHNQRAPYVFVCASVGDCKAFHISISDGSAADLTRGTRPPSSVTNVNDPGGRLGPYLGKEGSADLRNLCLMVAFCDRGDIIMICSDGVYDNLDPQQLNISCRSLGLDADDWEAVPVYEAEMVKDDFRCKFLTDRFLEEVGQSNGGDKGKGKGSQPTKEVKTVSLDKFGNIMLDHCMKVTEYSRQWMEEHPTARMPDARAKKKDPNFKGKMDHTSLMLMRVGISK